jgi:hypothetical protein
MIDRRDGEGFEYAEEAFAMSSLSDFVLLKSAELIFLPYLSSRVLSHLLALMFVAAVGWAGTASVKLSEFP